MGETTPLLDLWTLIVATILEEVGLSASVQRYTW